MERKEKRWRIAGYVFGGIGAALLVTILVLKLLKFDIMAWTLPLVAVVILFLITDERARRLKRERLREEAGADGVPAEKPAENTLPEEAFTFDETEHREP